MFFIECKLFARFSQAEHEWSQYRALGRSRYFLSYVRRSDAKYDVSLVDEVEVVFPTIMFYLLEWNGPDNPMPP